METTIKLGLSTICGGCAEERFNFELDRVLENILDPNTDPTATRTISMIVKIKPADDRSSLKTSLMVVSKTAPLSPQQSVSLIGKDIRGRAEAHEITIKQMEITFPDNVTPIKKEANND